MNLSLLLDMACDGFGERPVIGRRAAAITSLRLRELAEAGAGRLMANDAPSLVYVGVNGVAFPVALFSAALAGVPFVPLNYRLGRAQLSALLARHAGAVVIADLAFTEVAGSTAAMVHTAADWLEVCARPAIESRPALPEPESDAAAVIIYTSGTTSEPKGVVLRNENLAAYVVNSVEFGGAKAADATILSVPPYHIAAVANVVSNLYAGRRAVVLEQFSGDEWLDLVRSEQITHALVVPTMLARILDSDHAKELPSLRSIAYGGSAMPRSVIERALAVWPTVDFVNAYGLTETSSTLSVLGPEDHRTAITSTEPAVRARLTSAGRPVPGVEMSIRDPDQLPVEPGAVGRIYVRGQQISGEYAGLGSSLDGDGYFDTRDDGYLDGDGYLFIVGRTDDTIIRGGENIAPAEVEEAILSHPSVEDAVVVGLPDPEWGQRLAAVVVARPGCALDPEEIQGHVRTLLRKSKTPDSVTVWPSLPRTETGKLVRRGIVAKLVEQLT